MERGDDIAERIEVGVLEFSYATVPLEIEITMDVASFDCELAVFKPTIQESGPHAQSGVILKSAKGGEIVIVAADFPYYLAGRGVLPPPYVITTEYPMDQYQRVPMK